MIEGKKIASGLPCYFCFEQIVQVSGRDKVSDGRPITGYTSHHTNSSPQEI